MFEFRFSNFKFFPKDLLGQAGQSIDIPELLLFDACRGELRINEVEPDGWFLLMVGTKLDLFTVHC